MEENTKYKIFNRDIIKYIAIFAMTLSHISESGLVPFAEGTKALHELFIGIGNFTAVTMCYFLVEGYEHTGSKKQYGIRLFVFAVLSQGPFYLVFHNKILNVIVTLSCCFLILVVRERIMDVNLKWILIFLLVTATIYGDWPLFAPACTLMFVSGKGNIRNMKLSYLAAFFMFILINLINEMSKYTLPESVLVSFLKGIPILLSGAVVLYLYSGKKARYGQTFSKWFFYLYYPVHLLIIGLLAGRS